MQAVRRGPAADRATAERGTPAPWPRFAHRTGVDHQHLDPVPGSRSRSRPYSTPLVYGVPTGSTAAMTRTVRGNAAVGRSA